jgi:hypothetical protein
MVTAQQLSAQLKKSAANWKDLVASMEEKVTADSGRFELTGIPNPSKLPLKKGVVTAPVLNKGDNTASFAYVLQLYDKPAQKSFEEAKTAAISDYQNELEMKWMEVLKKKYPVTINKTVWSALLDTAKK